MRYRAASTKTDIKEVINFLVNHLYEEAGLAPIEPTKMLSRVWQIALDKLLFLVEDDDGNLIGSLSFTERDIWYSNDKCLIDNWFFLLKEYRDTEAARVMVQCAQDLSNEWNLPVMISITNPRRKRVKPFAKWVENDKFLLYPLGSTMVIGPAKETDNVLRGQTAVADHDEHPIPSVDD